MRRALLIARRELGAYLKTMSGYVIIAGVLLTDGLLFNVFAMGEASRPSAEILTNFFYLSSGSTIICAILLSMRLLAEEQQNKTIVLLFSSPVADWEIVLGKYLSAVAFLAIFLVATFHIPALVLVYGRASLGHIAAGYLGLLLLGSATLAIGTLGSALTSSQVLAAIGTALMVVALIVAHLLVKVTEPPLKEVFGGLAYWLHFQPFEQGMVQLRDVVYFVLATYLALFGATRVLEARRWK
jgi:ABC-2 type transport system permease protein